MANMSYVRFENTLRDLHDCARNLSADDLSVSESRARTGLIELCQQIAAAYRDVDEQLRIATALTRENFEDAGGMEASIRLAELVLAERVTSDEHRKAARALESATGIRQESDENEDVTPDFEADDAEMHARDRSVSLEDENRRGCF